MKKIVARENWSDLILLDKVEKKAVIWVFLISLLCLWSLIQANVLYEDDILRVLSGDRFWNSDGRPLSSLVTIALQLGTPLTDISPLPQIMAIALYSISSIYLGKAFKVHNLVLLWLGGIVFVLNPFNLQNFAYIFDSLTMGLAVFCSTVAFLIASIAIEKLITKTPKILAFLSIATWLFLSLCFYQAAISIYLSAISFYSLVKSLGGHQPGATPGLRPLKLRDATIRESVTGFTFSLASLFCSLLAYIPVKNFYITGADGYILRSSQLPSLSELPEIFIKNLLYSLGYLRNLLGNGQLPFLVFSLGIVVFLSLILLIFKKIHQQNNTLSKINNLLTLIILTLFYCLIIIVSFYGIGLLFTSPSWRPRLFMGFSAAVGISGFFLAQIFNFSRFLRYFLIFFLCLLFLSFTNISLTFGNTLHYQNSQEEIIATVLLTDLEAEISQLANPPKKPKLAIIGQLQPSELTAQAFRKYPLLENITTSNLRQNWWHGHQKLRSLEFKFDSKFIKNIASEEEKLISSSKLLLSRRVYDIYFDHNDTLIVLFKK